MRKVVLPRCVGYTDPMSGIMPILPRGIARQAALFLDFDGTLVDIAPRPDAIVVPEGLPRLLAGLASAFGGAVALLSGRPLEDIDARLAPLRLAGAGGHGTELRRGPDAPVERPVVPAVPASWFAVAETLAASTEGAILERKPAGFALHARACPEALGRFREKLAGLVAADDRFARLDARMAVELVPRGADKGRALSALMAAPPFAGRIPVVIGDDVTDEHAIAAARSLRGHGFRVGEDFRGPAEVRAWLGLLAEEARRAPAA